jgi:hypothetical protein
MSDPEVFKQRSSNAEWKAFCEQCKSEFRVDPTKDGPRIVLEHLGMNRRSVASMAGTTSSLRASDPTFNYRLAGHVETGKDSFSDPALGGLVTLKG